MNLRDAAKAALRALEDDGEGDTDVCCNLRAALEAEPQFRGPAKWTSEEVADGYRGIRWIMADGVYGRPTESDLREWLSNNPSCRDSSPPARQPLTSGRIARCMTEVDDPLLWGRIGDQCGVLAEQFARAIERAHGIGEPT